jgi:YD repeat-containing protein
MANNNLDTVTATGLAGTNDMTSPVLLYNSAPTAASPTYVRNTPTQWAYKWDGTGRITAILQASGGPSVPTACTVSGG